MKLRLVYPRPKYTNDSVYAPSRAIDAFFTVADRLLGGGIYQPGKRSFLVPPLNLLLLAALTPEDVDVDLVDERATAHSIEDEVDAVAITAMTADAARAYEISAQYRQRGVQVILGGIHPTVLPNEAADHADAVVIGEAEGIWDQLISDARARKLRKFYRQEHFSDLQGLPHPKKDLLDERYYITRNVIQTTRGCPHRCSFCSISTTAGLRFRQRPIGEVVREIEASTGRFFGFVDDNVNGHPGYAQDLFRALAPLDIHWYGDATLFIAENEKNLDLLAASGCKILLVGFESLSQDTLNAINKRFNKSERFDTLVKRIHDRGIGLIGSFILGLDGDGRREADLIVEFAERVHLDLAQVSVLTPYPGTELFEKLRHDNRILTMDWSLYDTTRGNVVFQPLMLSADELQAAYFDTYRGLYTIRGILRRLAGSRSYPTFFLPYNLRQRRKVKSAMALRRRSVMEESHVGIETALPH